MDSAQALHYVAVVEKVKSHGSAEAKISPTIDTAISDRKNFFIYAADYILDNYKSKEEACTVLPLIGMLVQSDSSTN